MIKRKIQKINSPYGKRTFNGETLFHQGVDLRSWNKIIWKRQPAVFPERCLIIKKWFDKWGGGLRYQGLETGTLFKSFHLKINDNIIVGGVYDSGEVIGKSMQTKYMKQVGSGEHEHFETWRSWKNGDHFNPVEYFKLRGIKYE